MKIKLKFVINKGNSQFHENVVIRQKVEISCKENENSCRMKKETSVLSDCILKKTVSYDTVFLVF